MSPALHRSNSPRRPWWAPPTTLLWVAFITVLIWLYADMEFTKTARLTVTIELAANRREHVALLSSPTHRVTFELQGSRRDLDEFIAKNENRTLTFDVSGVLDVGANQRLQATTVLEQKLGVSDLGFVIESASPAAITGIHLDRRVARELPVEFNFGGAELIETPTATVRVWAPQSHWDKIDAKTKTVAIRTERHDFQGESRREPITVKWKLPNSVAGIEVQPEVAEITRTVQIRERTDSTTVRVAVLVTMPYTWLEDGTWDTYTLVRDTETTTWVKEVEVTGAEDDIRTLQSHHKPDYQGEKDKQIQAYILLDDSDKRKGTSLPRSVQFRIPPDLKVKVTGGPYEVKFKLESRKTPAAGTVP